MRTTCLSLGALALTSVNAWTYPDCDPDNCYRNMADTRFTDTVAPFCFGYLDGSITHVPADYQNCGGDAKAISSVCSCITYTATHTATVSSLTSESPSAPYTHSTTETTTSSASAEYTSSSESYEATVTPSSSHSTSYPVQTSKSKSPVYPTSRETPVHTTSSPISSGIEHPVHSTSPEIPVHKTKSSEVEHPGHSTRPETLVHKTSSSKVEYTTSTIYALTEYTVTSCKPTVTNCPVGPHVTTEIYVFSTTVCPVASVPTYPPKEPVILTSIYYAAETHTSSDFTSTTVYPTFTTVVTIEVPTYPPGQVSTYAPEGPFTSTFTYYTTETRASGDSTSTTVYPTSNGVVTIVVPTYPPGEVPTSTTLAPVPPPTYPGTVGDPYQTTTSPGLVVTAAAGSLSRGIEMLAGAAGVIAIALL